MKKYKSGNRKKMPISIILIIIWMGFMAIRNLFRLIDLERFEINQEILGNGIAIINYLADAIILLAFILLIVSFILRKRSSWKYFIILIIVLIIGIVWGLFFVGNLSNFIPAEALNFVFILTYIIAFLIILFYVFFAYVVYEKRGYFDKWQIN